MPASPTEILTAQTLACPRSFAPVRGRRGRVDGVEAPFAANFGAAHADRFPPDGHGGKAFAVVAAAVARLTQHASSHFSGHGSAREGATSKAAAREALRNALDAISRTARSMSLDAPGFESRFRLPRITDRTLLKAARAFARDAAPFARQFVEHDLPETFLASLEQRIKMFEDAMRGRQEGKETTIAAQALIDEVMASAFAALQRLDGVVPNRMGDDAAALAVWGRARRIQYRTSRAKNERPAEAAGGEAAAV